MNTRYFTYKANHFTPMNDTVHTLFKAIESNESNLSKIFYSDEIMSYKNLNAHSDCVAKNLLIRKIQVEDLVGILMERSIDAVISQLGILKAGGAYLPLAPDDFPLERIITIFEDAKISYIISLRKYQDLIEELQANLSQTLKCLYIDEDIEFSGNKVDESLLKNVQVTSDNLAYVMYTSGSTGKPKGVMITHKNIISSVKNTNYLNFNTTDSILHAAPISFDAATFEIWGALLNGLDLHIIPEKIVHDFDAFSDYVSKRPISIIWLTSALFNLLSETRPDFFKFLKQLIIGGEALSPKHINRIRKLYPHLSIRNNYGPTENTIFSTSFLIDKTYNETIPIGLPITNRRAYILDKSLKSVPPQKNGLLYVAGDGLARGYLNLPIETLRKFVPDPFFEGERMYSTGDICSYNENGDIEYIGRADDQVKVRGHRIELGEIETVLRACPTVNQAVVLHKELGSNIKGLVAYIDHTGTELSSIKEYLSARLPQYMMPNYFEKLSAFPITSNGKLDRKTMLTWPIKREHKLTGNKLSIREYILTACASILNIKEINPLQSFFDQGGDSLSGTSLILELEHHLKIELPLHVLYETPIIDEFILRIENLGALSNRTNFERHRPQSLTQDAQLNFKIELEGKSSQHDNGYNRFPETIFLTGCTGFFGAFLLKELLSSSSATVYCLVRAKDEHHAKKRILETMNKYAIPFANAEANRIIGISGDLTQSNLGLNQATFDSLNQTIDIIIHNGAVVNYVDSYETLKKPNVFGTHEVIRLSCQERIIPIHYISSISVFETLGFFTGRDVIFENESVDVSEDYVKLGYSQSKWVAEKMMENARSEGLPINIYRSAYIMGHSDTGVSNTTDHIARYIAGCIEMGYAPILNECASLTPVNQLSQALSHIVLNTKEQGKTYHLCNPSFITVSEIYQQIQTFGFPLELIPYAEWKERLKAVPKTNPLYPLLSMHIHSAKDHQLTLPELYENNARFDCSHSTKALEKSSIQIGLQDPAIFERWLHNYVKAGLISAETFKKTQAHDLKKQAC